MPRKNLTLPKARIVTALLATVAAVTLVRGAEAGSVVDTVRAALATNPEVGVVKADRHAVDQELRQARGGYLPSVDFRGAVGPEYTNSPNTRDRSERNTSDDDAHQTLFRSEAQLKLSQMLFDGGEVRSEVERQTARVSSAAYRVEESAEFTALNAIEAHMDVLRNMEIVRLNDANISAHNRIFGQVRELERSGSGDIADVRQTEARIAAAEAQLALARGDLADATARYQRLVGEPPAALTLEQALPDSMPAGAEAAATTASSNSPTVKIAASDVDVAAAELRGTRANYLPRLDAEVSGFAGRNLDGQDGGNVSAAAMLVMRYNLYRGGADIAREREAFHRTNEARFGLENARRAAEEQARLSYNAVDTARARTVALRARAEAQRRTRDAYASQFQIGQRSLLDVLDAENELFLARLALVTAEYVETFAVYRVLAVTGTLLESLEVPLPREQTSIYRTPADLQTPAAIQDRSGQLVDPRGSPRPLRGADAGEAPREAMDLSVVPPTPVSTTGGTPASTAGGAPKPVTP